MTEGGIIGLENSMNIKIQLFGDKKKVEIHCYKNKIDFRHYWKFR